MRAALVLGSVALLVAIWTIASRGVDSIVLPSPREVWAAFGEDVDSGAWWQAVSGTLRHVLGAFSLVVLIGVALGVAMGRFTAVDDLARAPLILLQTIPTIALAAIALLAVGTGDTAVVAVTVACGVPFFAVGIAQGSRDVDPELVQMARALGAGEAAIVRSVVIPSLLPYVLGSSRVALGVAWHVAVVSEYLLGTPAVGASIAADTRLLETAGVFSWALTIVAFTIVAEYAVFRPGERWLRGRMR